MALEAGSVIGGKYKLFKALARGGMGAIWVARHTELDVSVAIKVIASDMVLSQTALSRFRQEARAAAQLRSPHVVQILDYGVDEGVPFMAMELLTGEDLGQRIEQRGRLPLSQVTEILGSVCKALKLAHEARIVHRDLKPGNVFLTRVGDDEIVKVLDFGIAKALSPSAGQAQTASATLVGSPLYMSPEQSRGDPVDGRSDLWSLAIVAYEALTGKPPFEGRGLGDLFGQICHGEVPRISTRGITAPGLDAFFAKALAKDPARRFETPTAFIEALRACQEAALDGRKAAPEAETQEIEVASLATLRAEPGTSVSARTGVAATNAGISSESARRPTSSGRAVWLGAALGAAALGLAGWAVVSFGAGRSDSDGRRAEGAPSLSAEAAGVGTPAGPQLTPEPAPTQGSSEVTPTPAEPAPTVSALASASTTTRPPAAAGPRPIHTKPASTASPTATTDDIFGLPKKK